MVSELQGFMNKEDYANIFHYLTNPENPYRLDNLSKDEKRSIRQKAGQHTIVSGVLHKVIPYLFD